MLEGLRLYDLEEILTKKVCCPVTLKHFYIGAHTLIHFNDRLSRMTYMNSMTDIVIFPDLHRNNIKFMGIGPARNYMATKIINDNYICLDKSGELLTWNVVNGKILK